MRFYSLVFCALSLVMSSVCGASAQQNVPDSLYPVLEYLLSVPASSGLVAPEQVDALVRFVAATPPDTSMSMADRDKATGGSHTFALRGSLQRVAEYVYNPDIPVYVTMPSSVRQQEWQDQATRQALTGIPQALAQGRSLVIRGSEREVITPDANTGGYYAYRQDRAVMVLPGPTGPVLISVACQPEPSEVGRKGCVVGEDSNWNYLYSDEKGLNKTGLGWVDSYMYNAHSVLIFVADDTAGVVRAASFKWLNAGWAGMNMVKPVHIINGIKRFAADFKTVLESPRLPGASEVAARFKALSADTPDNLRLMVSPYLEAIARSGDSSVSAAPFADLLQSGKYLQHMSRQELVKIVLQDYIKKSIGRPSLIQLASLGVQPPVQP